MVVWTTKLTGCLAGYIFAEWLLLLFVCIGIDCDGFDNEEKELLFVKEDGGGRNGRFCGGGGRGVIFVVCRSTFDGYYWN